MAAFVAAIRRPENVPDDGLELSIFPGSVTPAIFPARVPIWIGNGFVAEPEASGNEPPETLLPDTRFELEVNGAPVSLVTDSSIDDGRTVHKASVAVFRSGLPAGWHRFTARWYVAGKLVLSSDTSIEFAER